METVLRDWYETSLAIRSVTESMSKRDGSLDCRFISTVTAGQRRSVLTTIVNLLTQERELRWINRFGTLEDTVSQSLWEIGQVISKVHSRFSSRIFSWPPGSHDSQVDYDKPLIGGR